MDRYVYVFVDTYNRDCASECVGIIMDYPIIYGIIREEMAQTVKLRL